MNTYAIVPVKTFANGKKRLGSVLTVDERIKLSEAMLYDVLDAVSNCRSISKTIIVSKDERILSIAKEFGTTIVNEEEELGVNAAVALTDDICRDSDASVVIPQDLPLLQPSDLDAFCKSAGNENCVIITPSHRYDGTNALLRKPANIMKTHYDEDSYEIHLKKARENSIPAKIIMNRRLMLDLDEPSDITHIMSEDSGTRTVTYLKEIKQKIKGVA
ncbi:MAG: 2-phospho-L-lactate guanylyltransferase [Nitrososphaerales archaeon]